MQQYTEIVAIEKVPVIRRPRLCFGILRSLIVVHHINLDVFRKKVIKWNLDKFRLEFMGNNAESLLATAVVWFSVACFLALDKAAAFVLAEIYSTQHPT